MPVKKFNRRLEDPMVRTHRLVLAADIGGTNIRVATVDEKGIIHEKLKEPTGSNPLQSVIEMSRKLRGDVTAMGIAVAGVLNSSKSGVSRSPNIPSIENVDIVNLLKKELKIKNIVLENDANAAAFGEALNGAGNGLRDFFLITLGTGIGGGFVREGRLVPIAAEIGHITVVPNGDPCSCGNAGCLELYASGMGIVDRAINGLIQGIETKLRSCCEGNMYRVTPEIVYQMALDGDPFSRDVLKEAGRYLGIGIANVINIFSPEAVILTGGLTGMWNIYVQEAIKEAQRRAFRELFDHTKILPSELGDDAGLIGIARLVFQDA